MKIALIGYGKMGKAIEAIALQECHEVALTIDITNSDQLTNENLQTCDVAIEFTTPETAADNVLTCLDAGIPVVCGTTGWLNRLGEVVQACNSQNGTFLTTSNFSIGVNIFFELNKQAALLMRPYNDYGVTIEETHHTQKKDSPSGTAISLAEQIIERSTAKSQWVNSPTHDSHALEIISKRIDPAAGTHTVKYSSTIDDIEITHTAHNRQGFAKGALLAATFIKDKKGIFTMRDVLGF